MPPRPRLVMVIPALLILAVGASGTAQVDDFTPVTDATLQEPAAGD